jgi:SNF2 family DNA or RNA helicase
VNPSIVFSFWKRTLATIAGIFLNRGIPFVQLDGSLNLQARREVLDAFDHKPETRVLLMTLGTGAVGYVTFTQSYVSSLIENID